MNTMRLEKLKELMMDVYNQGLAFNLGLWYESTGNTAEGVLAVMEDFALMENEDGESMLEASSPNYTPEKECGYVACTIGHATQDPWFQGEGFTFRAGMPRYENEDSWDAVRAFFDLGIKQAYWLFSGGKYPDGDKTNAKEVAERIQLFIDNNGITE